MGYYFSGTFANTAADYLSKVETALTAEGWTIYDTVSSTRHVWKSPDVNGATGVGFFIELNFLGGVGPGAWIDWDNSAHAGIGGSAGGGVHTAGGPGYIYCNALGLFMVVIDGLFNDTLFVGQPRSRQVAGVTDGLCLSTAGMSASATTVAVNADLTGRLYVGQKVAIQNYAHNNSSANKAHRELVTITAVGSSSLSFTATSNAYDSGAKIGPPDMLWPCYASAGQFNAGGGTQTLCGSATNLNQTTAGATLLVSAAYGYSVNGDTSMFDAYTAGMPAETFAPMVIAPSGGAGQMTSAQPIPGFIYSGVKISGGAPAAGSKFTDGLNVYAVILASTAGGTGLNYLVGPTGDVPDFSTQGRLTPPWPPTSDTIYAIPPPAASAPSNTLNQGLN